VHVFIDYYWIAPTSYDSKEKERTKCDI